MKTALVTGGAGFIGTHLCARLLLEGYRVISLDNYFSGNKENHLPGVEYREGHTKDIARLVPEPPDVIFHLGEYSRVAKSLEEPELVWDLNTSGTQAVLEFWRARGSRLVYAGSSTKFAGVREDGVEGRDLSPYTWAKAANSELVANYGKWYGLSYAIAYFYNVYGPGERAGVDNYGTVIETFREQARAGKPLTVRAPGTQTRAFTHVLDTVDALVKIAESGASDEYGISASDVYSLLEVAAMFGGEVEMLPQTKSTRSTGAISTEKIEALGWHQEHFLKDYIEEAKQSV
ncbi:MAG TPA: NAD-dependent epimerase/dehydratase family protein [Candidatus Paceibacterota bacterium]|nr:NAD-dependent epimerase/dehydratase family protein [Candidatus Paceibacterota bacterium]